MRERERLVDTITRMILLYKRAQPGEEYHISADELAEKIMQEVEIEWSQE